MKNIIIERWKPIKGYEALYEVSNFGNVRSLKYGKVKLLKPGIFRVGYLQVVLCKDGKKKTFFVHRLVVEAFIGKIPKGMQVNHINENKLDNRLENLEIVTQKENLNFGTRNQRIGKAISKQLDLIEANWPYREYTFPSSCAASEFFEYKNKTAVGILIYRSRQRGENFINLRKTKYFFVQEG